MSSASGWRFPAFRGCAFINAAAEFPLEGNPVHQVSAEFYDHFRSYIADLAEQAAMVLIEGSLSYIPDLSLSTTNTQEQQ